MSGKATVVYWDSSAFLTLLKGEKTHGAGVHECLVSQAGAFDRGEIILATSTVGITEVLSADLPDSDVERFEAMIRRSNFQTVSMTDSVARQAARLRRHCYGKEKNGDGNPFRLSTPDAVHVVSAMMIKADVLVTLDTENKSTMARRYEMGMAKVSTHYPVPGMYGVPITRPRQDLPGVGLF